MSGTLGFTIPETVIRERFPCPPATAVTLRGPVALQPAGDAPNLDTPAAPLDPPRVEPGGDGITAVPLHGASVAAGNTVQLDPGSTA